MKLLFGDMRFIEVPEKADILVSELLGSFGDNELSPECLDGAMRFLKGRGVLFFSEVIVKKFFFLQRTVYPSPHLIAPILHHCRLPNCIMKRGLPRTQRAWKHPTW